MFHHVKELQFNARVSKPDVRFARLLLEQFGGPNGELKAAMQYFVQAFGCRKAYPDKYFNMSKGEDFKGPWNEGKSPLLGEEWELIEDPLEHVRDTEGLLDEETKGTDRTEKSVQAANKGLSKERKGEVDEATAPKNGVMSWSVYEDGEKLKEQKNSSKTK